MAREADPKGERTLGVLTKPDQVEEGCHGQWLQVLAGERYVLHPNYRPKPMWDTPAVFEWLRLPVLLLPPPAHCVQPQILLL